MTEGPDAVRVRILEARGFRNLATLSFQPGPHFNVIHGDNGAGKSSLLEALGYLSTLQSFRAARTDDIIALDQSEAVLRLALSRTPRLAEAPADVAPKGSDLAHQYAVRLRRHATREIRWNKKRPPSLARYLASFPTVLFHPGHLTLTTGGSELRRAFLDRMLDQLDPVYRSARVNYEKALRSRNRLLKSEPQDKRAIQSFDPLLAEAGSVLGRAREALIRELAPATEDAFAAVTDAALPLEMRYAPRVTPTDAALQEALAASYRKDCARRFTAEGPHADDVFFSVGSTRTARHHASQGQHRALVLALKMAELQVLGRRAGVVPPLLLDDVSSELDRRRNEALFAQLVRLGGQVFLTTTHPEFIRLDRDRQDFRMAHGALLAV